MLSVHMKVFDTGMVRALRISSFKRVASNAACSSSFDGKALSWARLLLFQRRRQLVFRVKFSHRREEKLQHKKLLLSCHRTCVTQPNQLVRRSCALVSFFLEMANQSARQEILSWYQRVAHHSIVGHECARFLSTIIAHLRYRALRDLWGRKRKMRNLNLFNVLSNF